MLIKYTILRTILKVLDISFINLFTKRYSFKILKC